MDSFITTYSLPTAIRPAIHHRYGHSLDPEAQFLMALDRCEFFFTTQCNDAREIYLNEAIELLTPLLASTNHWFTFLDRHEPRVQRLRSQFQAMLGTVQPGQSCCADRRHDCPTLCQPTEHAHLLFTLLSV